MANFIENMQSMQSIARAMVCGFIALLGVYFTYPVVQTIMGMGYSSLILTAVVNFIWFFILFFVCWVYVPYIMINKEKPEVK